MRRDNEHHIANYVVLSEAYERKAEKFKQDEQEYKDKLFVLEEEVKKLQETIEKLIIEKTSLESDLDSAKKDVRVLSSDDSAKRGQIGQDAVEDLWSGIKDKIDQFIKYFSYFTETYADDDTAEFAMDDMYEFLDKLERYGIKVIGKIGEKTGYDVSIHHLEGDKLPSGSPVRVVNTGWMVFGKVVSKAEVEKVEN